MIKSQSFASAIFDDVLIRDNIAADFSFPSCAFFITPFFNSLAATFSSESSICLTPDIKASGLLSIASTSYPAWAVT
jgi:hypothetical protein